LVVAPVSRMAFSTRTSSSSMFVRAIKSLRASTPDVGPGSPGSAAW
jgi:hypothetical protein